MWIHGSLCPLKGSEPTKQTRTSRRCLNPVLSSMALGWLMNTGVGLGTIFLNYVLDIDVVPAGQTRADAQGAFGTGERIWCPWGVLRGSRAHTDTYHWETHLPMAGETGPWTLAEWVGAPHSSLHLGQFLWPEAADGRSPLQHRPRSLQGCSTRTHQRVPTLPAGDRSYDRCMWAGEISLHTPFPAHTGPGHNAALSLQLAEETTQPFLHPQLPAVPWHGLSLAAITRGFSSAKQTFHGASARLFQLLLGQIFHETNWRAKTHTQNPPKAKENRIVEQQPWEEPKSMGRQQGKLVLSHCKFSFIQIQII